MITPLGQVTGELQDVREFAEFGSYTARPTISSTEKYTGGYSVRQAADGKCPGVTFSAQASLRAGYWGRHNGLNNNDAARICLFVLRSSSGDEVVVTWKRNGDGLALAVNNTVVALMLASQAGLLTTANTWHHFGITYVGGNSGAMTFWLNGIAMLSYSGNLPLNITACYGLGIVVGANPSATTALAVGQALSGGFFNLANYAYVDDLYVDGEIVSVAEAPPPDRFPFSLANGAGAASQWTPTGAATNSACVDEAVPNDDTDYVIASAANLTDKYATANITVPSNYGIVAAIPIALVKVGAAGPTLKLIAADGVNSDLTSAEKTPGTTYGYQWDSMSLAPDGSAWDESKFNAAEFGFQSAGTF